MARLLLNTRVLLWSLADSAPRHPYDSGVVNRRVAGERPRYAPYTEDTLVQQTTADYLEQQLGWESVYAHNHEDFGSDSLLGRASDRDVVLTRPLRERLAALNPDLPAEACDDAVRITAAIVSQTIVAANREKYDLLRDGVPVTYRDARSRRVRRRLRMFDFDEPANNHFLCVRELWVRGSLYRRRADVVGFVNGLPLLFIECKNIHRNLKTAFEQNYADYRDTVPHLFHHNAMVMFGNGEQAKIGSITSRWGHFHEWRRLAERNRARWTWRRCSRGSAAGATSWTSWRTSSSSTSRPARRGRSWRATTSSSA